MAAKFSRELQGACSPAPPPHHVRPPRVEFMLHRIFERPACVVYCARLLTAQDVFWPVPGLGCNCNSGGTWCKENGELQLHAHSCKETRSCTHDSNHTELVWAACIACFIYSYLSSLLPFPSRCNLYIETCYGLVWDACSWEGGR